MKRCSYCGHEAADASSECSVCGKDEFELVGSPTLPTEPVLKQTRYNTFRQRFFAGWIDGFILWPLTLLDRFLLVPERGFVICIVWAVISYSTVWLYSVVLHAKYGKTVGKHLMGVKVLDCSEDRLPTFGQALMRDIGYALLNTFALCYDIVFLVRGSQPGPGSAVVVMILSSAGMLWFLLEVITMMTNDKRRAFHDFIAGTVVVREEKQRQV